MIFLVIVEEIEKKVDLLQGEFERIGYEYMGNLGYQDVVIYEKGPIKRTHHVHIYQFDNTQEILRHLAFSKLFTRKIWQLLQPMVH